MSLTTKTLILGEELDRLDQEIEEVLDLLEDADGGTQTGAMLKARANHLNVRGGGVSWLAEEYGEDAELVIRGLDSGEYARIDDRASQMRRQAVGGGDLPGSNRNVYAAMGIVEAPFYDGDPDDLDAKITAVTSLPIGATKYIEDVVDDLTTVSEGNWRPLAERLAERSTDSTEANSSTTPSGSSEPLATTRET